MDGNDYTYWTGSSIVLKKSISNEAQRLITEVNKNTMRISNTCR